MLASQRFVSAGGGSLILAQRTANTWWSILLTIETNELRSCWRALVRTFYDPFILPDGRELVTLTDAAI